MEQKLSNEWRSGNCIDTIPDHLSAFTIIENYCRNEEVKNRYGKRINTIIRNIDQNLKKIECTHVSHIKQKLNNNINLLSDRNKHLFGETGTQLVEDVLKFYGFIEK